MISIETLKRYQQTETELSRLKQEYDEKAEEFKRQNINLINAIAEEKSLQEKIVSDLTIEGLQEFEETQKKKLTGGLGIREMQVLDYEESKAFEWAKVHEMCLKLDRTAFEKIAKAQPLDLVKYGTKKIVTFPAKIQLDNAELTEEKLNE